MRQASAAHALAQSMNNLTIASDGRDSRVTGGSTSWLSRNDAKDGPETLDHHPDVHSLPAPRRVPETPLEEGAKDVTNLLTQRVSSVLNEVEERLTDQRNTVPSASVYKCSECSNFLFLYAFPINLYLEVWTLLTSASYQGHMSPITTRSVTTCDP
jgi:hypothetical protein